MAKICAEEYCFVYRRPLGMALKTSSRFDLIVALWSYFGRTTITLTLMSSQTYVGNEFFSNH